MSFCNNSDIRIDYVPKSHSIGEPGFMETQATSEQQIACTGPLFDSSLNSHIKGLEISARWDGVQEHPATVSILFTVRRSHQVIQYVRLC